jgi:hypothetical protein
MHVDFWSQVNMIKLNLKVPKQFKKLPKSHYHFHYNPPLD